MLFPSEICNRWHFRLISAILLVIFLVNFTFIADVPNRVYTWSIRTEEATMGSTINDGFPTGLPMCSRTCADVGGVISMSKFGSQCSIDNLTRLNVKGNISNSDSIWKSLEGIADNPRGSASPCPRELKVADFPTPRTALVSSPGSGNTWTRHLIQQLTGIHTGSIYEHSYISTRGFPYEGVVDNMIVVKTHKPPNSEGSMKKLLSGKYVNIRFERLFILLRNPYASFMAEYKRSKLGLGKVRTALIDPQSEKWVKFVSKYCKIWTDFVINAFGTKLPSLVIYYEDMQSCLLPELVKISSFLGSQKLNEFAYCCTLKQHEGSYHRKPSNQSVEDVYSDDLRKLVNGALMKVAVNLKKSYPEVSKRFMTYILP